MPTSYSLSPYTGTWTRAEAGHLLRRTLFGPTLAQIDQAVQQGLATTVTNLMSQPTLDQPITYHEDEHIVPLGQTWVDAVYPSDEIQAGETASARGRSLYVWTMTRLSKGHFSVAEKMNLFWHNHFSALQGGDVRMTYDYYMLLNQHVLGDFKQLVKDMTINPQMLEFLNGGSNNVYSPNENYSRELLELYTIGKGAQIGEGDYSNYTEHDIQEGAKILTGYYIDGYRSDTLTSASAVYNEWLHDDSEKILSHHFDNAVISNNEGEEYKDYIDLIFTKDEVARHICRKFYRYFVGHDINDDVETNIIEGLASTLIANNYVVQPALEQLFLSEHFYDQVIRGCQVKSPLEALFSVLNSTESRPDYDLVTNSEMWLQVYWSSGGLGQSYGGPPSVAGWPAYYQAPAYTQMWVNAGSIKSRIDMTNWITRWGMTKNNNKWKVDTLGFLSGLTDPADPVAIIDDMADIFTPKGLSDAQKLVLKTLLLNGLPDFEWGLQYSEYIADPNNEEKSEPIAKRLEITLAHLFTIPEFHIQ